MPSINRSVLVPYSAAQMFDLVADVEKYPEFMPWCDGAQVLEEFEGGIVASVTMSISKLNHSFATRNTYDYPKQIKMSLVKGPFSQLSGIWSFIELDTHACKVEFDLDYTFENKALSFVIGPIFNKVASSFIDSFTQRAEQCYG